jgi:hypothetical protein
MLCSAFIVSPLDKGKSFSPVHDGLSFNRLWDGADELYPVSGIALSALSQFYDKAHLALHKAASLYFNQVTYLHNISNLHGV